MKKENFEAMSDSEHNEIYGGFSWLHALISPPLFINVLIDAFTSHDSAPPPKETPKIAEDKPIVRQRHKIQNTTKQNNNFSNNNTIFYAY